MKLPRWMHKIWAHLNGYFWLPCALCGKMRGGHEWGGSSIMISWGESRGVCSNCREAAREYNRKWMDENPPPPVTMEVMGGA